MKWLIGIAVLILVAIAVAVVSRSVFEPAYKGRSLSQWLTEFDSSNSEKRAEANEAVRHMGKRAVPFLAERLFPKTPSWKVKLMLWLSRQSIVRFRTPPLTKPETERVRIFAACDALGPAANAALPALEQALYKFRDFDAAYAMARVGQEANPALMRASTSKDYFVRITALYFLHVLRDCPETLSVGQPNSDFLRRSRVHEKTMLAIWLPNAASHLPGASSNPAPISNRVTTNK